MTHQSEEIFIKDTLRKYDFCEAQFRSTRDAMCSNWFSDILWGGMHSQLEHRLFPTLTLPLTLTLTLTLNPNP